MRRVTVDIDTGGTHTDGFFARGEEVVRAKVETTPHDLTVCFQQCLLEGARLLGYSQLADLLADTAVVRFSTTIGTNTLIQRNGPKLGVLVTSGYENTLYAASAADHPVLGFLVPVEMVVGIRGEVGPAGGVAAEIEPEQVKGALKELLERGARMIVVSLKGAYRNPAQERQVKEVILSQYPRHYLGSVPVLLSSEITVRPGEAERTNVTLLNAYFHPNMARTLYRSEDLLREAGYPRPLLIVHADGGTARVAKTRAIDTYNSGPVAGLHGSAFLAENYGHENVVTLDIGGTSSDLGVLDRGRLPQELRPRVEGIPINLPSLSVATLGAGGGSIASVTAQGSLRVGPESAGALPGPACYGLGGESATVTDANLVLGFMDPDYFLGGKKRLNRRLAEESLTRRVAGPLGMSLEKAAGRVIEEMEGNVISRLKLLLKERGISAGRAVLYGFGGAGGLHCSRIADGCGIPRVYTFSHNPVFCAFGASTMEVVHVYESYFPFRIVPGAPEDSLRDKFNETVRALQDRAFRDMRGEGFPPDQVTFALELETEGGKDGARLTPVSRLNLLTGEDFAALASELSDSGRETGRREIRVEVFRLRARAPIPRPALRSLPLESEESSGAQKGERPVFWLGKWLTTPIYSREKLRPGNRVTGPAIIEGQFTNYAVPSGKVFVLDSLGNGVLD